MKIKNINFDELDGALELIWKTFLEYEAPEYSQEGIEEFKKVFTTKNGCMQENFMGHMKTTIYWD